MSRRVAQVTMGTRGFVPFETWVRAAYLVSRSAIDCSCHVHGSGIVSHDVSWTRTHPVQRDPTMFRQCHHPDIRKKARMSGAPGRQLP
jgi:hypothetical protein